VNNEELLESIATKLEQQSHLGNIEPERIRPVAIMTRERRQLGDLERDFQKILDTVKYDERVPPMLAKLADLHLREANYGRAIILYEMTLGLDSEQILSWVNMGLTYLLVGDPKDAISCFGSALALEPDNTDALVYLSQAQLRLDEYDECNKNLDRALHINADHPRALLMKGKYFKAIGKTELAVTWLKRAIQRNPLFLPAMMELGNVYFSLKQYEAAIEILTDALAIDSEQPYALATMGDIYYDNGDLETAIFYYDKAISIKFDDPELWIKKGDLHRSQKSYQQASNAYQKAINANPEYVKAWVRNGTVMLLMQDESTALEYLNTALALEPDNAEVAHQRGLIYYSLERYEEALSDFDKAFSVEPSNPMHLYYRALMLEILDRNEEAKRTWVVAQHLFEEFGNVTKVAECKVRIRRISLETSK